MSEKAALPPLQRLAGVSWPGLLLYSLIWIGVGAASGAAGAYWLITRYDLNIPVNEQALTVDLPPEIIVDVELQQMDLNADADPGKVIMLPVRLRDEFQIDIMLENSLPLKMVVPYKGELPVDTVIPIDTVVETEILGIKMKVPVRGLIPIRTMVDVDLRIPINQSIPVSINAPITAKMDHTVQIPIPAKQNARIRMNSAQMPITIQESEFVMPLSGVSLTRPGKQADDAGQP